jgi:hypothetical protein
MSVIQIDPTLTNNQLPPKTKLAVVISIKRLDSDDQPRTGVMNGGLTTSGCLDIIIIISIHEEEVAI